MRNIFLQLRPKFFMDLFLLLYDEKVCVVPYP